MKFLRDIIAERSEPKEAAPVPPTPAVEPAAEPEPQPAARSRRHDRTMTRLSDGAFLEGDDVFKRLLGEDAAAVLNPPDAEDEDLEEDDSLEEPVAAAESGADDEDNLFDDLMDEDYGLEEPMEESFDQMDEEVPEDLDPVSDEEPDRFGFGESFEDELEDEELPEEATSAKDDFPEEDFPELAALKSSFDRPMSMPPRAPRESDSAFPAVPGRSAPSPEVEDTADMMPVPAPASGRSGRGAGRVKTRLLGFGTPDAPVNDPFASAGGTSAAPAAQAQFPVGWLVVASGPGRGASFALFNGVSQIGRGDDQAVRLDFGDTSISRSNHAAIAYDTEQGGFYLGHGGKANMVRLNDRPVLSTEELSTGAMIRIGETTLRFVALCDDTFSWTEEGV